MGANGRNPPGGWTVHAAITAVAIFVYVLMEWLFFVTKPSFMTAFGFLGKLQALLVAPLPLFAAGAVALVILWMPAFISRGAIARRISSAAASMPAAATLAALFFLLVDNFTFTVMRFGIRMAEGPVRYVYLFLLLVLILFSYEIVDGLRVKCSRPAAYRAAGLLAAALIAASISAAAVAHLASRPDPVSLDIDVAELKNPPNIILISGDGLNAENLSIYGYRRATTPFLQELSGKMLVCENAYSNADVSAGSIASIFTGKLPTRTKVYYPPEILQGKDAYEHLPGILRKHGYRSIDISERHYTDPVELNMKDSFDWVNFRRIGGGRVSRSFEAVFGEKAVFFMRAMRDRLAERFLHVIGVRRMTDPFAEVAPTKITNFMDAARIEAMFSFIDEKPSSPFFAHIHLLGTHGPIFFPARPHFSAGQHVRTEWSVDGYDDAILDFDYKVRNIFYDLRARNIMGRTLLIICSDHGQRYALGARIPLVFLFPEGRHSGRIDANVQNLDIAPTILDYLGIEKPAWMNGRSLIAPGLEPRRPIFTMGHKWGTSMTLAGGRLLDKLKIAAPFYSLGSIGVILCHKAYLLDLEAGVLAVFDIKGHTAPCSEGDMPSSQDAGRLILDHLAENGYDISSIQTPLAVRHDRMFPKAAARAPQ